MAKVTAQLSVRGVDLKEMRARAIEQMQELEAVQWTITECSLYSYDDEPERDGLARRWNATFTLEAQVSEGRSK